MAELLSFLFRNGGKTKHTKTLTSSSNGTVDMGEDHEYRYMDFNPDSATFTGTMLTVYGHIQQLYIPYDIVKHWKYVQVNLTQKINTYGNYKCSIATGRKVATSSFSGNVSFSPNVTNWNAQYVVKAEFSVVLTQS